MDLLACLLNIQNKTLVGCYGCMQTISYGSSKTIGILWSWSYWSTFILTWYVSGMVSSLFWLFLLMVHNTHKPCVWSWMHWILSVGLLHLMFVFELFHNGFHHFSRIQTVGILFIFGCGANRRLWYHQKPDCIMIYEHHRFLVPLLQGYEDAGDFTVANRLKTSAQGNLMLYGAVGAVSMIGVFIMVFMGTLHW